MNKPINVGLRKLSANLPDEQSAMPLIAKARSRLPGRAQGGAQPVSGQDDRERELHARDGV